MMKIIALLVMVPILLVFAWLVFDRVATYFWPDMDLVTKVCLLLLTSGGVSSGRKA